MRMKKILTLVALASMMCLVTACGSSEKTTTTVAAEESDEMESQNDNVADEMQAGWLASFDERVDYVRNGHPTWIPEVTYAEAYESFYANPKWRAFDSTENKSVVEFSGECTYDDEPAEVYIQFQLNDDDTFTFSYCSLAQNNKKVELDSSVIIQFLYNPFEEYMEDVLDKEIDSDTQTSMRDAYRELLEKKYGAMSEEATTYSQTPDGGFADGLTADKVIGTYDDGEDECIVVKSVTSAGVIADTMLLNESGVGGRSICTDVELQFLEGGSNQVKFGDNGNIRFFDGSLQLQMQTNGYVTTFTKTSNETGTLENDATEENEIPVKNTENRGGEHSSRYIWPESLDDPGSYMCSWSSDELITEDEMAELDYYSARIVMNEIYARHGRKFNNQELQEHFNSKNWYNGTIAPENFSEDMLNGVEKQNILILKDFMEKHPS